MALRDPSQIKRDGGGQFAATDARSLAEGLAAEHAKRTKKKPLTAQGKAILKTIGTGEDHLGDLFNSTEEMTAVADELEKQGLIAKKSGGGYALTDAGKAAITPKKKTAKAGAKAGAKKAAAGTRTAAASARQIRG